MYDYPYHRSVIFLYDAAWIQGFPFTRQGIHIRSHSCGAVRSEMEIIARLNRIGPRETKNLSL